MEYTIEKIVEHVLIQNRITNYNRKDLELQLQTHPNYPSFQSITDTLDYFNIDNIAVEVPLETLDLMPKSFITLIKINNVEEIASVTKKNQAIILKYIGNKNKTLSFSEFKKIWIPKTIAVEYSSSRFQLSKQLLSEDSILSIFLLLAIFTSSFVTLSQKDWTISTISYLLLLLLGSVLSVIALRESTGIQSPILHRFCTTIGTSNCGNIINSTNNKLLKNFSLADSSFVFFGSILTYILFFGINSSLLLPAIACVPFISYSFYIQSFITKKWCVLCLSISAVTITCSIIILRYFPLEINPSLTFSFISFFSFFTLAYIVMKEKIIENKKIKAENIKLNQFKKDGLIFNYLFSLSRKIEYNPEIKSEIILGNPDSNFKIITLSNPMCGYCKNAFEACVRILKTIHFDVQIVIRFKVNLEDISNHETQITLRLIEIFQNKGSDNFIKAYRDWFNDRTYSQWIKKHSIPSNSSEHIELLKQHTNWANTNNLNHTPITLINNSLYPHKYGYSEFFHFIRMMVENHNNTNKRALEIKPLT